MDAIWSHRKRGKEQNVASGLTTETTRSEKVLEPGAEETLENNKQLLKWN